MSKQQLTANLLSEFIDQTRRLRQYMSAYRLEKGSHEETHYGRAVVKLQEAQRELEEIIEHNPMYEN